MSQQHRQLGTGEDVRGWTAEDHLAQPALRVGALDQKVGSEGSCLVEKHLARREPARGQGAMIGVDPFAGERPRHILGTRSRDHAAFRAERA